MAKYDNIDVNGKQVVPSNTPSYDSIMKQKAKDTKKALDKQKKEDDAKKADEAMQKEVDAEADAQKEVEKKALENNGSTVETRDKNKAIQEGDKTAVAVEDAKVAAKEPVENADAVEQIASETKVEEPEVKEPTNLAEALTSQGVPENVTTELVESDEGQAANGAVESGDPAELENVVTPEGESVLKGSYDENGNYVPYVYTEADTRLVKNKGWAAALTIISAAMSALGVAAGIPIVPINFFKFGATPQEDLARMNQVETDYAKLRNAGTAEAQTIEKTRAASQEANISDVDAYKNLSDEDVQKAAQVNASVGGQNTQLDVQREAQEWEAKQKELDRDFAKVMNELNTESQIAILKQQGINAQDLATLMNDLEAQKIVKKLAYAKEAGLTPDETAKWLRAEQGITQFGAAMGYAGDAAKVAGEIANTFIPGGSDKGIKKFAYDGKAANSKMFNSKRKFW